MNTGAAVPARRARRAGPGCGSSPGLRRLIDAPTKVLARNDAVNQRNLRRCGLTHADLQAVMGQHGHEHPNHVHLAIFEAKGAISVLSTREAPRTGHARAQQSRVFGGHPSDLTIGGEHDDD